jgi:hypothetical protein
MAKSKRKRGPKTVLKCGHDWNPSEERRREIPRCVLPNGDILEWNERLELRVDPKTGITYPPGENQGFQLSRNNAGNAKS